MDQKTRYKQIIKENNELLNALGDSYRRIAYNYTKKARGYGVKNIDTEVKIKAVLEELTSYEEQRLEANIVIPNMTEYIESHIKELSKAPNISIKIKEIIAVGILLLCLVGYFVLNAYFNRKRPLGVPSDTVVKVVEVADKNYFCLMWEENPLASEGYTIKVYKEDGSMEPYTKIIRKNVDANTGKQLSEIREIGYDGVSTYIFEIVANSTDKYNESEVFTIKYPS